jgi:hypothetical protein
MTVNLLRVHHPAREPECLGRDFVPARRPGREDRNVEKP